MRIGFSCRRKISSLLFSDNPRPPYWRMAVESFKTQPIPTLSLLPRHASLSFRLASSCSSDPREKCAAFTVSYLISSCGLSEEAAMSALKQVLLCRFNPGRPDSILNVLRDYGFSNAQLTKIISGDPALLLMGKQFLVPMLQFFNSIVLSKKVLCRILCYCPTILSLKLQNQIIPWYKSLKGIVGGADDKVASAFKHSPRVFLEDPNQNILPNIAALREIGVPESSVVVLVTNAPSAVLVKKRRFRKIVKEVMEIGFDPKKKAFLTAIQALTGMTESTREKKMEAYRKWGWSNDEILLLLFRPSPTCMSLPIKKIMRAMDFLANKMGWDLTAITECPMILGYDLDTRIIPRCSVVKALMLKGLMSKDTPLHTFLDYKCSNKKFLDRYVTKYENEIPQLSNLYHGEVGISDLV